MTKQEKEQLDKLRMDVKLLKERNTYLEQLLTKHGLYVDPVKLVNSAGDVIPM